MFNEFTKFDWVLLALLMMSVGMGAWRGLLNEVLSILVWVFAFYSAQWWAPAVLQKFITEASIAEDFKYAVSFVLVFVVSAYVAGIFVARFKTYTDGTGFRMVDKSLGMIFGALRGVAILLAVTMLVQLTPVSKNELWVESVVAKHAVKGLQRLQPYFSDSLNGYLGR